MYPATQRNILAAIALLALVSLAACTSAGQPSPPSSEEKIVIDSVAYTLRQPYDGHIYLTVKGTLSDGCSRVISLDQSWEEHNLVHITLTATPSEAQTCPQVDTPCKETIRIEQGITSAGTYTAIVNGVEHIFTLTEDDVWRKEGGDPGS